MRGLPVHLLSRQIVQERTKARPGSLIPAVIHGLSASAPCGDLKQAALCRRRCQSAPSRAGIDPALLRAVGGAAELDGVRFRCPSHLTKFEEASSKRRKVRHEQRFSDSLWRGRHRCGVPLNGGKGKAHRKRPGKAALQVLEERISIRVIMPMGENC